MSLSETTVDPHDVPAPRPRKAISDMGTPIEVQGKVANKENCRHDRRIKCSWVLVVSSFMQ